MSYGALSKPAVRALSNGAKLAGCWMNTGEGGLSSWHLEGGCDIVFQIGTAKYGVRDAQGKLSAEKLRQIAAHENVRMFELKLSIASILMPVSILALKAPNSNSEVKISDWPLSEKLVVSGFPSNSAMAPPSPILADASFKSK